MIIGGELTSERVIFECEEASEATVIRGLFTSKATFFTVPPYDERVNVEVSRDEVVFTKNPGVMVRYEDAKFIIQKIEIFKAVTPQQATEMITIARENLPSDSTLFFPSPEHPLLEVTFYYDWIRFDVISERFVQMHRDIKNDITSFLPNDLKIFSNGNHSFTLRASDLGKKLFAPLKLYQQLGAIFISYNLIPMELHDRFAYRAVTYGIREGAKLALYSIYRDVKADEVQGGVLMAGALQTLRTLSKVGDFTKFEKDETIFLKALLGEREATFKELEIIPVVLDFYKELVANYELELASSIGFMTDQLKEQEKVQQDVYSELERTRFTGVDAGEARQELTGEDMRQIDKDGKTASRGIKYQRPDSHGDF